MASVFSLAGRRALVCGATGGIGLACALAMARQGSSVTLLGRSSEKLARALGLLREASADAGGAGGGVAASHDTICADLGDPAASEARVSATLDGVRVYHILVNNTGGPPAGGTLEATPEQLLAAFNAQLITAHRLVRLLVPGWKALAASGGPVGSETFAGYGRVINITSTSVKQPIPNLAISNIVRPAVAAWGKCLATELGPLGVTVNNVLPGYTATERLESLMASRASKQGVGVEQVRRDIESATPTGRLGRAEEIAAVVAFLASAEAAYVNGINVPVDGGRLGTL